MLKVPINKWLCLHYWLLKPTQIELEQKLEGGHETDIDIKKGKKKKRNCVLKCSQTIKSYGVLPKH